MDHAIDARERTGFFGETSQLDAGLENRTVSRPGALLGVVGAACNAATVGLLRWVDSLPGLSPINCAAIIGATVGLVAWFAPAAVGGGETLTQAILAGHEAVGACRLGASLMAMLVAMLLKSEPIYA